MHIKRILTAIAIVIVLAGAIYGGPTVIAVLAAIIGVMAVYEFFYMMGQTYDYKPFNPICIWSMITCIAIIVGGNIWPNRFIFASLLTSFLVSVAITLFYYNRGTKNVVEILKDHVFATLYITLPLALGISVVSEPNGIAWLFFLFLAVFASDIGAFYVGSFLGKHKLCPKISPNKSVEGAIGGFALSMICTLTYQEIWMPEVSLTETLPLAFLCALAAQIGDLFESVIKRSMGVKDSGTILPGHGGVLDRIDSLLMAIPVFYVMKFFVYT